MPKRYIYKPRGRAYEYSPLALNHYLGCDHNCQYCYNRRRWDCETVTARDIDWDKFVEELNVEQYRDQVLLSFIGDPYCHADMELKLTRKVLRLLLEHDVPVAVLTKGGTRCLRDRDLFDEYSHLVKVGATLTFHNEALSKHWEPKAATPMDRLVALANLHEYGIRTFASIEPVLIPGETLEIMEMAFPVVDEFRVGKLNHDPEWEKTINWRHFGESVIVMLKGMGKAVYLKEDLRAHLGGLAYPPEWEDATIGFLRREEE